jgi:Rieske Fe-S protein
MADARINGRRALLKRMAVAVIGTAIADRTLRVAPTAASEDPATALPRAGDLLAYADGEQQGAPVKHEDLEFDAQPVFAFPRDPDTGLIKNGSRLNKVSIVRLNPADLDKRTAPLSAAGALAYSTVCPHEGCDVSAFEPKRKELLCSCHYSRFDARKRGKVKGGPATRSLPVLPLALNESGTLVVAGPFTKRPRFTKPSKT